MYYFSMIIDETYNIVGQPFQTDLKERVDMYSKLTKKLKSLLTKCS